MNAADMQAITDRFLSDRRRAVVFHAVSEYVIRSSGTDVNAARKHVASNLLGVLAEESSTYVHRVITEEMEKHRNDWPVNLTAAMGVAERLGWWEVVDGG